MRAMFLSTIVMVTLSASAVMAQDAVCIDQVCFDLVAVKPAEQPDVEIEILQFVSCDPMYDMTQLNGPVIAYTVMVNPIRTGDPRLQNYFDTEDGNEKILVNGEWVRFDAFTHNLKPSDCAMPIP